jgi:hypothetical protein
MCTARYQTTRRFVQCIAEVQACVMNVKEVQKPHQAEANVAHIMTSEWEICKSSPGSRLLDHHSIPSTNVSLNRSPVTVGKGGVIAEMLCAYLSGQFRLIVRRTGTRALLPRHTRNHLRSIAFDFQSNLDMTLESICCSPFNFKAMQHVSYTQRHRQVVHDLALLQTNSSPVPAAPSAPSVFLRSVPPTGIRLQLYHPHDWPLSNESLLHLRSDREGG